MVPQRQKLLKNKFMTCQNNLNYSVFSHIIHAYDRRRLFFTVCCNVRSWTTNLTPASLATFLLSTVLRSLITATHVKGKDKTTYLSQQANWPIHWLGFVAAWSLHPLLLPPLPSGHLLPINWLESFFESIHTRNRTQSFVSWRQSKHFPTPQIRYTNFAHKLVTENKIKQ